jgi:parallel beta-helix repeat protein
VSLFNLGDGIDVTSDSSISGSTCAANGFIAADGAGIHVIGPDNCVEGNPVSGNDRGVDVDAAGNLIIGNTATNNTTAYTIVAKNRYGPIVDISAGGTPAVNGSAAVGTMTTADPWANFAY